MFKACKDGGKDSNVWFYGIEFKKWFSVALPWKDNWQEYTENDGYVNLTHGRKKIEGELIES